jgi:predicted N-acetyltransferase YhbS
MIREITTSDSTECGRIMFEAFRDIADRHGFARDFPSVEAAVEFVESLIANPFIFGVVAENNGRVVGSNFLWEYDVVRGVGPLSVDPTVHAKGTGRKLMQAAIERGKSAAGIRLTQDAFNVGSMALYVSLGFDVKEPMAEMSGDVAGEVPPGYEVRPMIADDHEECNELCLRVLGFARAKELANLPPELEPFVAIRDGRIVAYATSPTQWIMNHAVAENEDAMKALLTGAAQQTGKPLSFLLPVRQAEMFRWCIRNKMRIIKPVTLMAKGKYDELRGVFMPSVTY